MKPDLFPGWRWQGGSHKGHGDEAAPQLVRSASWLFSCRLGATNLTNNTSSLLDFFTPDVSGPAVVFKQDDSGTNLRDILLAESEISVSIDIRPRVFPNWIIPRSRGRVPVAILTTDAFDAATVGLVTLYFTWTSYLNPDAGFRAIMPPGSRASFSLNDVRQVDETLGIELIASKHVHYSILVAVGVLIMTLSLCGLRQRLGWPWYVLVVTILLVGWNDAITSYAFGMIPVPLVPATLAAIGLYIARRPIFESEP